jgi:hypothetical protein
MVILLVEKVSMLAVVSSFLFVVYSSGAGVVDVRGYAVSGNYNPRSSGDKLHTDRRRYQMVACI